MLKAYALGIVAGSDGGRYEPDALLNREQAAAMMTRVYKKIKWDGWTLANDSSYTNNSLDNKGVNAFADDAKISDWAKPSVYFMAKYGIIAGMDKSKNLFAPKNTTKAEEASGYANATREQALAISIRMFEKFDEIKDGGPVSAPQQPTPAPEPKQTSAPQQTPTPAQKQEQQQQQPSEPTNPAEPSEPTPPADGSGKPGEKPTPPAKPQG